MPFPIFAMGGQVAPDGGGVLVFVAALGKERVVENTGTEDGCLHVVVGIGIKPTGGILEFGNIEIADGQRTCGGTTREAEDGDFTIEAQGFADCAKGAHGRLHLACCIGIGFDGTVILVVATFGLTLSPIAVFRMIGNGPGYSVGGCTFEHGIVEHRERVAQIEALMVMLVGELSSRQGCITVGIGEGEEHRDGRGGRGRVDDVHVERIALTFGIG